MTNVRKYCMNARCLRGSGDLIYSSPRIRALMLSTRHLRIVFRKDVAVSILIRPDNRHEMNGEYLVLS
jgi:hypothetical protein